MERQTVDGKFIVGCGATYTIATDSHAGTIIRVSPNGKTVWWQRDKAIRSPAFKPERIPGGFAGVVVNGEEQAWTYERNPQGEVLKFSYREKTGRWKRANHDTYSPGLYLSLGRHEYYDYNF